MGEQEIPSFVLSASLGAKLQELLHYISSTEINLCALGCKDFVKLLKGIGGGELLRLYLRNSPECTELLEVWKLRQGRPGSSYIVSLISALLSHPDGRYLQGDRTRIVYCRALNNLARLIIDEKLQDVCKDLKSKDDKRQKAALQLLASVVRRSSELASEVSKKFDFKLLASQKLGEYRKKKKVDDKRKHSTRKPFVGFAMSFLEVGRPGLLRWILQQKDMHFAVLRGLGNDDDETLIYVLSTLRDRVLPEGSLVPPGLRSVLFGSVTLEQLASISGRENGGLASELAHEILLMVCTNPSNGLMPDLTRSTHKLRGNQKRLLELMKKLRASEVSNHRDLLLAIVRKNPWFGSAYMEEFPYYVEDHKSPNWYSVVSLAANVVSAVGTDQSFGFLDSTSNDPPHFDGTDVQNIIKSVCPRPFTRANMNKGLLHSNFFVKNGTLRLFLEELRLLDTFMCSLDLKSRNLPSWETLKREIENEVQTLLPDPQVLLSLLASLSSLFKSHDSHLKRKAGYENSESLMQNSYSVKKRKVGNPGEDADIIIGGMASDIDNSLPDEIGQTTDLGEDLDDGKNLANLHAQIWGSDSSLVSGFSERDSEIYFCTKICEALQIYLRVMPSKLEGSVDFFMNILNYSPTLPTNLLISVLSLLVEYIRWTPGVDVPQRIPPLMYKNLQTLINLSLFSPLSSIRAQAHRLSVAAMLSTGAFDNNPHEVDAWFLFLPDCKENKVQGIEVLQDSSSAIISFLCDAVSTMGNNLFKYWDIVRCNASKQQGSKDHALDFSPLAICVLQKCLRVIKPESRSFPLHGKTMISFYVSSTLKYILQTQVDGSVLSAAVVALMSDTTDKCSYEDDASQDLLCEWRPLKSLLLFARSTLNHQIYHQFATDEEDVPADNTFSNILIQTEELLKSSNTTEISGIIRAFVYAVVCTPPILIMHNFPFLLTVLKNLHGVPALILPSMFFVDGSLLAKVFNLWPVLSSAALELTMSRMGCKGRKANDVEIYGGSDGSELAGPAALSLLLEEMPFHVLFQAIMSFNGRLLLEFLEMETLLLGKISESTVECHVSYLLLVLFWVHQIQLSHSDLSSLEITRVSAICVDLLKGILAELFASKPFLQSPLLMHEVAEGVFNHPAAMAFLSVPSLSSEKSIKQYKAETFDAFSSLLEQSAQHIDFHIFAVIERASDHLWSLVGSTNSLTDTEKSSLQQFVQPVNSLIQRLMVELRNRLELSVEMKNIETLLPVCRALLALVRFISPFQSLASVRWIFERINVGDVSVSETYGRAILSIACHIASCAYGTVDTYLQQTSTKRADLDMFWKVGDRNFDNSIIGEIYIEVLKQARLSQADFADSCLLKAISAVHRHKSAQHLNLHPLSFVLLKVIANSPLELIFHCINRTSVTRAKTLSLTVELNQMHMSLFGCMFCNILLGEGNSRERNLYPLSSEDLLVLLPTVVSFLRSVIPRYGKQCCSRIRNIPRVYYKILFNGLSQWKSFVSAHLCQEEDAEFVPSSMEELLQFTEDSYLGKAVHMLQYHFLLNGDSLKLKKCLKLFTSILPDSARHKDLLDCDIQELSSYSTQELLRVTTRVITKITLCKMLLFPECEASKEVKSDRLVSSRIRFLSLLVCTWQQIVKKFPMASDNSSNGKSTEFSFLCHSVEAFFMSSIQMLTMKMRDDLIQQDSIPFLDELIRSSLLYRFEDPKSLKSLRSILTTLGDGKFSCFPYLQLLLAHSHFPHTLCSITKSSESVQLGAFLRPMSSILRSLTVPLTNQSGLGSENDKELSDHCTRKLEVLKLLRTLFHLTSTDHGPQSPKENEINSQELLVLLLSSYDATLSDVDQEIYSLIREIEVRYGDFSNIAETDLLWGSYALKLRKERALEQNDAEALEQRRTQVRENLPIDPKICAATVLYFSFDRAAVPGPLPLNAIDTDGTIDMPKIHTPNAERIHRYDPVFIMRFSLHMLSVGFIEPVEFASLGLLAVSFVCLSSVDDGLRKSAYEALTRFTTALEECQKKKDVISLKLLLNYVQNGIEEPWQRLPSVITLFAAEASFVLLDPAHDHYAALSKLLTCSSKVNMKSVPMFPDLLWSSAISFKSERLWILRLIYAGLNSDDDAHIFIRNSIFENLLSFYSSPVSDDESRELILQVVKKFVKFPKVACYLVEHCGLFSWLSSVLSSTTNNLSGDNRRFYSRQLVMVLEVTNYLASHRNITEWLQTYALEQLSELSSRLLKLLGGDLKLMSEGGLVVDLILHIMTSTLKISQMRKIYQPHFTVAVEGLYHLCDVISTYDSTGSRLTSEYGLSVMLMSSPQPISYMDEEKLSKFVTWAISVALRSDNTQIRQSRSSRTDIAFVFPEEEMSEEPLMSKLLRWITASVILGRLSQRSLCMDSMVSAGLSSKNLQLLLEGFKGLRSKCCDGSPRRCEEFLIDAMLYLQQLLGSNCRVLPSVTSALCLLIPDLLEGRGDESGFFPSGLSGSSLMSRIRCPPEADPSWRWSYYQPWKDLTSERTNVEEMDEYHACQTLLVAISNYRWRKPAGTEILSPLDVEKSGVFEWERSLIQEQIDDTRIES